MNTARTDYFSWLSSEEVWLGSKLWHSDTPVMRNNARLLAVANPNISFFVELCDAREMAETFPSTSLVSAVFSFTPSQKKD